MPIITLLSDFGLADTYVGVMKGVMLGLCPEACLVDLCHLVPRQDVRTASWQLAQAWRWFPPGSVHLAVVDPGVGGERRALAATLDGHYFVVPDNGMLSHVAADKAPEAVHAITDHQLLPGPLSGTFHGRDLFAPVAARLAGGYGLAAFGPAIDDWLRLDLPVLSAADDRVQGRIDHIDVYGNLITTITNQLLPAHFLVRLGDVCLTGPHPSYQAVPLGATACIPGSGGFLEIAINHGSAQAEFDAAIGDEVVMQAQAPA